VVGETRAVECNLLDAGSLGLLGDALANGLGSGGVATLARAASDLRTSASAVEALASTLRRRRKSRGIDVQIGAVHGQARHALRGDADAGLTRTAKTLLFFGQHDAAPYFFLVSLIVIFSSA
jgi:hypothetical protein